MAQLTIGLTLPLSGRYAGLGRQAAAALELFCAERNAGGGITVGGVAHPVELRCLDDRSQAARCAEIYRSLCFENRADLILGPYSSGLCTVAAPIAEQAGMVLVNHGGAADHLYQRGLGMIVGVLSPASEYLTAVAELVSRLKFWRKRIATVRAPGGFAQSVVGGLEARCHERAFWRRGVRLTLREVLPARTAGDPHRIPVELLMRLYRSRINVLVAAGSFEDDLAVVRAAIAADLNIPVLACVAAGVEEFARVLGEQAEGMVGPSQWEESLELSPALGPAPARFAQQMRARLAGQRCDYPAAQIYAAGLLSAAALSACRRLDQVELRAAFNGLRTSTLFGNFAIEPHSGRQVGHQMLLVQWHRGAKVVIHPLAHEDQGGLEFPSGLRLLLAAFTSLRIRGAPAAPEQGDEQEPEQGDERDQT